MQRHWFSRWESERWACCQNLWVPCGAVRVEICFLACCKIDCSGAPTALNPREDPVGGSCRLTLIPCSLQGKKTEMVIAGEVYSSHIKKVSSRSTRPASLSKKKLLQCTCWTQVNAAPAALRTDRCVCCHLALEMQVKDARGALKFGNLKSNQEILFKRDFWKFMLTGTISYIWKPWSGCSNVILGSWAKSVPWVGQKKGT